MQSIWIKFSSRETVTRACDSSDRWDRDDTCMYWEVYGFTTEEPDKYSYMIESAVVDNADGLIFAVVVDYDTGDSFGRDEGRYCFVDAFSDPAKAADLASKIRDDAKGKTTGPVVYTNDTGKEVTCGTYTWKGYFEHFNSVRIETVSRYFD